MPCTIATIMRRLGACLLPFLLLAPLSLDAADYAVEFDVQDRIHADFGTYFFGIGEEKESSGVWPCNFWSNFDPQRFRYDATQLKIEGGTSMILLFPFVDEDAVNKSYIQTRFFALGEILTICDELQIDVRIRVGYAWDIGNPGYDPLGQVKILTDSPTRARWYRFADKLYSEVRNHKSYKGAFISWEDFWTYFRGAVMNPSDREKWGTLVHYPKGIVPPRNSPQMIEYFDAFDELFVNDFFRATLRHIPELGIEVRMDDDPVFDGDRHISSFTHTKMYNCPELKHLYFYWGPFMGAPNQGDEISADQAMQLLKSATEKIHALAPQAISITLAQFNFVDNTPGFSRNSRIQREGLEDFLVKASRYLALSSIPTYTWSNSSYFHNSLSNGTFSAGRNGWRFERAIPTFRDNNFVATLLECGSITQTLGADAIAAAAFTDNCAVSAEFSARALDRDAIISTSLGEITAQSKLAVDKGWTKVKVDLPRFAVSNPVLSIASDFPVEVDNIVLSNHLQELGPHSSNAMRDSNYATVANTFNDPVQGTSASERFLGVHSDGWISGSFSSIVIPSGGSYQLTIQLFVPDFVPQQIVSISSGPLKAAQTLALAPGTSTIKISGKTDAPFVLLRFDFSASARPPNGDLRALSAHLNNPGSRLSE